MIVLDTHAWIWFVSDPRKLSRKANETAVKSVFLPAPMHPDPADRIIAATALTVGVPLVTKDERLLSYRELKTIW